MRRANTLYRKSAPSTTTPVIVTATETDDTIVARVETLEQSIAAETARVETIESAAQQVQDTTNARVAALETRVDHPISGNAVVLQGVGDMQRNTQLSSASTWSDILGTILRLNYEVTKTQEELQREYDNAFEVWQVHQFVVDSYAAYVAASDVVIIDSD